MAPKRLTFKPSQSGSALIMTLIFIVLLTIEAALVMLIITRSAGEEGMLRGQNITARRATEVAIEELQKAIFADLKTGMTSSAILTKYQRGGASTIDDSHALSIVDAGTGTDDTANSNTQISAWVQEYRGNYFHLVGRAQIGNVDLISHKWLLLNPCVGGAVLTTILSGVSMPGSNSVAVDSTGRVIFGQSNNTSGNLWTWKDGVLTTLATGLNRVGYYTSMVAPDDRFFIGSASHMYTYKDGVLSTITPSGIDGAGFASGASTSAIRWAMTIDPGSRLYFSAANWGGRALTWKSGILSTILNTGSTPYMGFRSNQADRVYFYLQGASNILSWSPNTGLSTSGTVVKCDNCSYYTITVDPTGRVNFGDFYRNGSGTNTSRWAWDGANLTTIAYQSYSDTYGVERNTSNTHHFYSSWQRTYVWTPSNGLSTIAGASTTASSVWSIRMTSSGRAYWGHNWSSVPIYSWSASSALSTLITGRPYPGDSFGSAIVGERLYIAEYNNPGNVYTYEPSTGLTTIVSGAINPGAGSFFGTPGLAANSNGYVVFGENDASGTVRAWHLDSGTLTTILTSRPKPGVASMVGSSAGFYFGEEDAAGNFYFWSPGSTASCNRGY